MAHANHTILEVGGAPAFVVVPYADYLDLTKTAKANAKAAAQPTRAAPGGDNIPHEVVGLTLHNDWSLIRAWREHLGFTQTQMAEGLGVSQSTYSSMEAVDAKPRKSTRERIAAVLGVSVAQLG